MKLLYYLLSFHDQVESEGVDKNNGLYSMQSLYLTSYPTIQYQ